MKEEPLYRYYINYLNEMFYSGKISNGHFSLLKISRNNFDEFKYNVRIIPHFILTEIKNKMI
jgi:hypothetical protein